MSALAAVLVGVLLVGFVLLFAKRRKLRAEAARESTFSIAYSQTTPFRGRINEPPFGARASGKASISARIIRGDGTVEELGKLDDS